MRISNKLYKFSGVEYATNSNIYGVLTTNGIVLIDCGFQENQWNKMKDAMKQDNLDVNDVTDVFLTHSDFDHAGNVKKFNNIGAKIHASKYDAEKIETGNPAEEELFQQPWICGNVDDILTDGKKFDFGSDIIIKSIKTPGHSEGSYSFLISIGTNNAICIGDMFFVQPKRAKDDIELELGYMGNSDFNMIDYRESLLKLSEERANILLPGHYYHFYGETTDLFKSAYKLSTLHTQEELLKIQQAVNS